MCSNLLFQLDFYSGLALKQVYIVKTLCTIPPMLRAWDLDLGDNNWTKDKTNDRTDEEVNRL